MTIVSIKRYWCVMDNRIVFFFFDFFHSHFCACSKPGPGFQMSYVVVPPFCVLWVKMKNDCLFCWYWGNCWPSLFIFIYYPYVEETFSWCQKLPLNTGLTTVSISRYKWSVKIWIFIGAINFSPHDEHWYSGPRSVKLYLDH